MPNKANGNCLYEAIIDNVNSRSCFKEDLNETPEYYRMLWNMEGEEKVKNSSYYPFMYSEEEWIEAWKKLQTSKYYDLEYFGDLAIISCAHSLKKNILIMNTPWQINNAFAHDLISVISANGFDLTNKNDTEVPIVLAYDGNHFESLIPVSFEDIEKTVDLVRKYKTGNYNIPSDLVNVYKWKVDGKV